MTGKIPSGTNHGSKTCLLLNCYRIGGVYGGRQAGVIHDAPLHELFVRSVIFFSIYVMKRSKVDAQSAIL